MHSDIMSCHMIVLYLLTKIVFVNLNKAEILLKIRHKIENKLENADFFIGLLSIIN